MKRGTILIILPTECGGFPIQELGDIEFPASWIDYLDGMINVMYLPKGGSLHIGKASIEVLGDIHKQIHAILGD